MVNEGLQRLIINALMINATCSEWGQESKLENLTNRSHRSIARIGAISRIHNV